jgi:hypothetical protein
VSCTSSSNNQPAGSTARSIGQLFDSPDTTPAQPTVPAAASAPPAQPVADDPVKSLIANFAQTQFEVIESTDDTPPDGGSDRLEVFRFHVGNDRTLRCFPSLNIKGPAHWMKVDGSNRLVACLGKGCALCEVASIDLARFVPAIDMVSLECGFIRTTVNANRDGAALRPRKTREGIYDKLATLAPASMPVVDLKIGKRTEVNFEVSVRSGLEGPPVEYTARFQARLVAERTDILASLFEFYTNEQLHAMPVVQRALKLKGM